MRLHVSVFMCLHCKRAHQWMCVDASVAIPARAAHILMPPTRKTKRPRWLPHIYMCAQRRIKRRPLILAAAAAAATPICHTECIYTRPCVHALHRNSPDPANTHTPDWKVLLWYTFGLTSIVHCKWQWSNRKNTHRAWYGLEGDDNFSQQPIHNIFLEVAIYRLYINDLYLYYQWLLTIVPIICVSLSQIIGTIDILKFELKNYPHFV